MPAEIAVGQGRPGGSRRIELDTGWELASTEAGMVSEPADLHQQSWSSIRVPGTIAQALAGAGLATGEIDGRDWWYRVAFAAEPVAADEEVVLCLEGIATISEVYVNGRQVVKSDSMFASHRVPIGNLLTGSNVLTVCCRALAPRLGQRRKPRARWRTKLVSDGNLRFYRTMLLGRAPGFAPGPPVVGLWRPVALDRRRGVVAEHVRIRADLHGADGSLTCHAPLRSLTDEPLPQRLSVTLRGCTGEHEGELTVAVDAGGTGVLSGTVKVPGVAPWWPHSHGAPELYEVTIGGADSPLHRQRIGFRHLQCGPDLEREGLSLRINDVAVFVRGAVWTPLDLQPPQASGTVREILDRVVGAGLNMIRIPGTAAYESAAFHDLCDELGILVWQDFMFANLDYPESDPEFMAAVEREGREVLARLGGRPSLAVVCGNSEVAQQVAMLGLDPSLAEGPLYGQVLPRLVREAEIQAPYVPSAPWAGDLPFRPDRGVANYYGVGAYRRPLEDARRADVRFASECLAFANVPDQEALEDLDAPGGLSVTHPAWKAGVPRDSSAGWDFDDVRDHYLELVFGVDPVALRSVDQARYLELSRAVSGEVMAEVFGEWRRDESSCSGGLVLWLKDLRAGAGWGLLDHRGHPKLALHHLRRQLAPVAVWGIDEGLGGIVAHVANDSSAPVAATLRVSLYRDCEQLVDEAVTELSLAPHTQSAHNVEELLGRFVDVSWAYRFGPPAQDVIALSLERCNGTETELLSQSFRFPGGRPIAPSSRTALGLTASLCRPSSGSPRLTVASMRLAYGVRVGAPGHIPADDGFCIEPGHERTVELTPSGDESDGDVPVTVTALNLDGHVRASI